MQKISIRKLSVLGLVLMAASAVTAAVIPSKVAKSSGEGNNNGTLRNQSASASGPQNVISCIPRAFDEFNSYSCTASATITTAAGRNDSTVGANHQQTQGNTSQTKAVAGDQQSVLVP